MAITTAMLSSYKRDLLSGLHSHNQSRSFTGTTTNASRVVTAVSALTGLAIGNMLSGAGIPAGTIIKSIDSATQITMSDAATASASPSITTVGDVFKMALIKSGMAGTYGAASTSYADITGNSDEASGTGYTAGGQALTNVDPSLSGTTALTTFSPNPSWTGVTVSVAGCMIYNSNRNGPLANAGCSVHDFGGTQTVTNGTLTIVMPTADASNAILRIA